MHIIRLYQLNAISKKIDVIYNDLYLSWDLLDDMYSKASDYQKKEEYFIIPFKKPGASWTMF